MKRKKGFTLIELLVVVAIIALLASILFPVFAQARAKARQAGCVSNLKQFGLLWSMYAQDWDDYYPVVNDMGAAAVGCRFWHEQLKSAGLLTAKQYPGTGVFPTYYPTGTLGCPERADSSETGDVYNYYSYGCNRYPSGSMTAPQRVQTVDIDKPGTTFCMADMTRLKTGGNTMGVRTSGAPGDTAANQVSYCHSDGANFLFFDGHVQWLKKYIGTDRAKFPWHG